jgi:hypothetical protein
MGNFLGQAVLTSRRRRKGNIPEIEEGGLYYFPSSVLGLGLRLSEHKPSVLTLAPTLPGRCISSIKRHFCEVNKAYSESARVDNRHSQPRDYIA